MTKALWFQGGGGGGDLIFFLWVKGWKKKKGLPCL